jgi:hypothetical protein
MGSGVFEGEGSLGFLRKQSQRVRGCQSRAIALGKNSGAEPLVGVASGRGATLRASGKVLRGKLAGPTLSHSGLVRKREGFGELVVYMGMVDRFLDEPEYQE